MEVRGPESWVSLQCQSLKNSRESTQPDWIFRVRSSSEIEWTRFCGHSGDEGIAEANNFTLIYQSQRPEHPARTASGPGISCLLGGSGNSFTNGWVLSSVPEFQGRVEMWDPVLGPRDPGRQWTLEKCVLPCSVKNKAGFSHLVVINGMGESLTLLCFHDPHPSLLELVF